MHAPPDRKAGGRPRAHYAPAMHPAVAACPTLLWLACAAAAQFGANYNGPPIEYGKHTTRDRVARLRAPGS